MAKALPIYLPKDANEVLALLEAKHHEGVFVPECKFGPSGGYESTGRLDAWAMRPTWSPVTTIGYEIKVSVSDFRRDGKWPTYLDYCHEFYFVVPWGLIDKAECPEAAGLMYATKNLSRLITKKKAPRRESPVGLVDLMTYVLMWRTRVRSEYGGRRPEQEFWREWMARKEEDRVFGYDVAVWLKKALKQKLEQDQEERWKLENRNSQLANVQELCDQVGLDLDDPPWDLEGAARTKLIEKLGGQSPRIARSIRALRAKVDELLEDLGVEEPA